MPDNIYINIKTNIHIQPARDEIQAPNTTDIHIQQIYIYSRLSLSIRWPKLRTRQKNTYIYNKCTYTQGCLSASKGPSSEPLVSSTPPPPSSYIHITNS